MSNVAQFQGWYDTARTWFAIIPPIVCPVTLFVNAPFGRFTPSQSSILLVDGIKSWIVMELVSPLTFMYTYAKAPLSATPAPVHLNDPRTVLSALFLLHYLNRAIISPLRTPSRSKSHIIVPAFAVVFNLINGALMGTYLSSPDAAAFLAGAFTRPAFWAGVALWAGGLAGNILHDEVLLDLRRSARAKGKARDDKHKGAQEHYAVPHGYLYALVSYPNYLCEWCEWIGFALAAAPLPSLASLPALLASLSPPWLFVLSEVLLMLPRAYKGHQWYLRRFPDYPKERKAVVPFVF
ncbi:3-oxo-5-alpha-steroid 4-dehydrogenase-domain-containing protein [Amylocystis lapponica]|nr:3-oxo-5-alpha-steroid 4-dehydrogenase-domain-containing protein [Amylocystis lapponica]KAH9922282.1 3-oxo-5-alpha-steroid 4-dehydrogenase-domain-containing protein [Amylocystis lapponica]